MRMRSAAFAVALLLFLAVPSVKEAHALSFGLLKVHPGLEFRTIYDDNIFSLNSNKVHDWYFQVSPDLLLQLQGSKNLVELEYRADIYRYVDTGDANDVEDHNFRAGADIKLNKLEFTLSDLARRAHELRSEENPAVIGITPLSKYWNNDLSVGVTYQPVDRFKVGISYENYFIDYDLDENQFRNRMDNSGLLTLYYRFLAKTSLLVQGIYRDIDHTQNTALANSLDSREYWALGGLTWDITAKTTGTIRGGYEWKDFKDPSRKDFQSGVYLISAEHRFTPKTSVLLDGTRQANESDDPSVNYYTTTNGRATVKWIPITKFQVAPFGAYTYNAYGGEVTVDGDTARRKDNIWAAGIDLSYFMNKWVTIAVGYQHSKRSSNLTFYDYTDNMAMISIKGVL